MWPLEFTLLFASGSGQASGIFLLIVNVYGIVIIIWLDDSLDTFQITGERFEKSASPALRSSSYKGYIADVSPTQQLQSGSAWKGQDFKKLSGSAQKSLISYWHILVNWTRANNLITWSGFTSQWKAGSRQDPEASTWNCNPDPHPNEQSSDPNSLQIKKPDTDLNLL